MKKLTAIFMALVMMITAAAAIAEDTSFTWEIPEADAQRGAYQTFNLNAGLTFKMFIYNDWHSTDTSDIQAKSIGWAAEDGRTLVVVFGTKEEVKLNNLDEAYEQVNDQGYVADVFNMNGMDAVAFCSEDMISTRGMIVEIPEGFVVMRATGLTSEDQIDDVDNMLYSLTNVSAENPDVGVKSEELDMENGHLFHIYVGKASITMYVYNDLTAAPKQDSWDQDHKVGRADFDNGKYLDVFVYPLNELGVETIEDVLPLLTNSGFEGTIQNVNGLRTACFYTIDTKAEQGVALIMDDSLLFMKVGTMEDEDQEAWAVQMLWSVAPAND